LKNVHTARTDGHFTGVISHLGRYITYKFKTRLSSAVSPNERLDDATASILSSNPNVDVQSEVSITSGVAQP